MKTRLLLIVGLMMAAVACGQKSVEKKIADYKKWDAEFGEKYQQTIMGIMADSTLTEDAINTKVSEYSDSAFKEYIDYNKNLLSQNKSNALGLEIIKNIYTELEDDELKEALDALDKDVAEGDDFVKSVGASIVAKAATAEGKMFTDFEVDGVKFSDFIGKGKYVLVDF